MRRGLVGLALALAACGGGGGGGNDLAVGNDLAMADDLAVAPDLADPADLSDPCWDRGPTELPARLSCTGLYSDPAQKTIAADAKPYTPGWQFWSDGAVKERWLSLPPNTTIDATDPAEWVFPVGTKVWKQFSLAGKRVETRLFWKRGVDDWTFTVYRWAADESDATRLESGETNVDGTTYEIPATGQCLRCHAGHADKLLGVEAVSLGVSSASGVTLATLAADQRLAPAPARTALTIPDDASNKAVPALGFLHINCGTACHNRRPTSGASFTGLYMRLPAAELLAGTATSVSALDTWTTAANVAIDSASFATFTAMGYKRLIPKDSAHSLIPTLAGSRDPALQMPPLVTHIADTTGVQAVKDWIDNQP